MGKWSKLDRPMLPEGHNAENPQHQDQVNKVKDLLRAQGVTNLPALTVLYANARAEHDRIKKELSAAQVLVDATDQLLREMFRTDKTKLPVYFPDGRSIYTKIEPYASVVDKDKLLDWSIKEGLQRKLTLPWQTLNSLTKQRLDDGLSEPDGVEAYLKETVVYMSKPKAE